MLAWAIEGANMSQSEIAGGRNTLPGELPALHRLVPDLELRAADDRLVRLSDYRGRKNLVLVFANQEALGPIAGGYQRILEENGQVIAVVSAASESDDIPFPVLLDVDGEVGRRFGAVNGKGEFMPALYITDRFGEIYSLYRTRDGRPLPTPAEIVATLAFINIQCPECAPPEWPD
jgi:peroxiredoxin